MAIRWGAPPPDASRLLMNIHTVKQQSTCWLLGDYQWVWVHWTFGRSMPCLAPQCPHCEKESVPRTVAYAPVLLYHGNHQWPAAMAFDGAIPARIGREGIARHRITRAGGVL
jgi:hypothetical protein